MEYSLFYYPIPVNINGEILCRARAVLTSEERERADAFRSQTALDTFLLGRLILKTELASRCGVPAASIQLDISENGKPTIAKKHNKDNLHFSLSHCKSAILVGIANCNIGVDIEEIDRLAAKTRITETFFAAGVVQQLKLCETKNSAELFTQFWTLLESRVKLLDSSIFIERNKFDIVVDDSKTYTNTCGLECASWRIDNKYVFSVVFGHASQLVDKSRSRLFLWNEDQKSPLDCKCIASSS